jgi:hypothetical protein
LLGPASGATDDYAYGVGINASFTVELRGNAFVVPTSDIPLSGSEFTAGLLRMLQITSAAIVLQYSGALLSLLLLIFLL